MKNILVLICLLMALDSVAQFEEIKVVTFDMCMSEEDGVKSDWNYHKVVFTFNYGTDKNVKMYLTTTGVSIEFIKITPWEESYMLDNLWYRAKFVDVQGNEIIIDYSPTSGLVMIDDQKGRTDVFGKK